MNEIERSEWINVLTWVHRSLHSFGHDVGFIYHEEEKPWPEDLLTSYLNVTMAVANELKKLGAGRPNAEAEIAGYTQTSRKPTEAEMAEIMADYALCHPSGETVN